MAKKVLLIADDDDMNRVIIRKFLKNDYEILEAENGKRAMDILHEEHVDALLLDIIMPEMDGFEVLEAMKQDDKLYHVGVLVATSTKEKTEREALSRGADDIVAKPYDPVVIKKRLANIMAVKTLEQQQEILKDQDIKALLHQRNEAVLMQFEKTQRKLVKFTDMIRANKSNYKLVDEILDEIKVETQAALDFIAKED